MPSNPRHRRATRRGIEGSVYVEATIAISMITTMFAGVAFFIGMYTSKVSTLRQAREQAWQATIAVRECPDEITGLAVEQSRTGETATQLATGGRRTAIEVQSSMVMGCNEVPTLDNLGAFEILFTRIALAADDIIDSATGMLSEFIF